MRIIKNTKNLLFCFFLIFFMNGCMSYSQIMDSNGDVSLKLSANQNANGALWISELEEPSEGNAVIVFFRPPIKDKTVSPEKLYANGKFVTDMKQYGFYPLHIKEGKYTFTLGSSNPENVQYKKIQAISGNIKAGESVYIEIGSYVSEIGRFSAVAPGFFYCFGDYSTNNGFSSYKQNDDALTEYIDYRLSATRRADIQGLVNLKYKKDNDNALDITKKEYLAGVEGALSNLNAENLIKSNILKDGVEGAIVTVLPSLIEKSITGEYTDDYLEYIGTTNSYDMNYLFE